MMLILVLLVWYWTDRDELAMGAWGSIGLA